MAVRPSVSSRVAVSRWCTSRSWRQSEAGCSADAGKGQRPAGQLSAKIARVSLAHGFAVHTGSAPLRRVAGELLQHAAFLRRQSPATLFRLQMVEIGLPLMLSLVSILFLFRYPLTEQRCYAINELLQQRRDKLVAAS